MEENIIFNYESKCYEGCEGIMQKRIETMVLGIGELKLDALSTFFPNKSKELIISEIEKSDLIGVDGNKVVAKSKMKELEQEKVVNKKLNLVSSGESIKAKGIEKKDNMVACAEDISYGELLELITKYNRRVKDRYEKLVDRSFVNIRQAIVEYYGARFDVVKNNFELSGKAEIYSLIHKKSKLEVSYVYIGEYLSKEDFRKIQEKFVEDTLYFCITRESEVVPNVSNREFYLKDINEIVDSYLNKYKLKEIDYTILKIN